MAYYHLFYTYDIICKLICQVVSILILYVQIISFIIKDQNIIWSCLLYNYISFVYLFFLPIIKMPPK